MRPGVPLFALFAVISAVILGNTYIDRMPNHAGYFLVHANARIQAGLPGTGDPAELKEPVPIDFKHPAKRLVVIVVDGLRRDQAETMTSAQRLAARGQCRNSDQGDFTVSRPVYSVLSTGLESDRTGSRNNENTRPLGAESFWEVARRSGRKIRVSSHLPWWPQLFPRGFDEHRHTPQHAVNVFESTNEEDAKFDIDLFHPLYVDEMGHFHGGKSPEYTAAVKRVDGEINALLDRLDFERDAVILTADHGHRDIGGHGGEQREIREVLACFAGAGLRHAAPNSPETRYFDGRVTAPLMSVLMGVPFPENMRAGKGEDHIDDIWSIVTVDPAYEQNRRAAIERVRSENARQIAQWLGSPGGDGVTWTALYAHERFDQRIRTVVVAAIALGFLILRTRRAPRDLLWLAGALGAFWLAHHAVLGDFNFTVINRKAYFVPRGFVIAILATLVAVGINRALERKDKASANAVLARRLLTALVLVMITAFGHIWVYGWPLGFPLPEPFFRYLPFILSFLQAVLAVAWVVASRFSAARATAK